ncbi:hypothetical protein [Burkholderia anthina]|uniref:Uncharacterized protein n=1 Tax=Burkholderia anthina TaxID=179879 RepID=A0ABS2B450_9BURK|nr:hypothetical protein [Burkholderia anthina]MBM2767776.1 hypothetical protein [Burkholderia anthina]
MRTRAACGHVTLPNLNAPGRYVRDARREARDAAGDSFDEMQVWGS